MVNYGRLAQHWLERLLDMQKVTRSSRVLPITCKNSKYKTLNLKQTQISKIQNPKFRFINENSRKIGQNIFSSIRYFKYLDFKFRYCSPCGISLFIPRGKAFSPELDSGLKLGFSPFFIVKSWCNNLTAMVILEYHQKGKFRWNMYWIY